MRMLPASTGMLPQMMFRRGLAGAVAAHYRDELTLADSQTEILKQAHLIDGSLIVKFSDMFDFQHLSHLLSRGAIT